MPAADETGSPFKIISTVGGTRSLLYSVGGKWVAQRFQTLNIERIPCNYIASRMSVELFLIRKRFQKFSVNRNVEGSVVSRRRLINYSSFCSFDNGGLYCQISQL